jgi:hypothetical protein
LILDLADKSAAPNLVEKVNSSDAIRTTSAIKKLRKLRGINDIKHTIGDPAVTVDTIRRQHGVYGDIGFALAFDNF